eukprot:TRINITY_DN1755_c0_g1_i1.p1 TRINITY_DN1755_c0_g1~~TRINITY_DN1755_c0_g1_i1.p1  ORF type:complete len:293 (-),score=53.09 TRINITY_DN1755_c0_g1_i1:49-927(-)
MNSLSIISLFFCFLILSHSEPVQVTVGDLSIHVLESSTAPEYVFHLGTSDSYQVQLYAIYEAEQKRFGEFEMIEGRNVSLDELNWDISDVVGGKVDAFGLSGGSNSDLAQKQDGSSEEDMYLTWSIASGASDWFRSVSFVNYVKLNRQTTSMKFDVEVYGYQWTKFHSVLVMEYAFLRNGMEALISEGPGKFQVGEAYLNVVNRAKDSNGDHVEVQYQLRENRIRVVYSHFDGNLYHYDPEFGIEHGQIDELAQEVMPQNTDGMLFILVIVVVSVILSVLGVSLIAVSATRD